MNVRLYPAQIFDLKWKATEVCAVLLFMIFVSLFTSLPIHLAILFLISFLSVNLTYISYKYFKTKEESFEPDFVPNRSEMIGILTLWFISNFGMMYFVYENSVFLATMLFALIFSSFDVARYLMFSRAYRRDLDFHTDAYSIASLEWEEASRAFQLANYYHLSERFLSAFFWWMFSVGRYWRVLIQLDGHKNKEDPEYKAAELHMKASQLAFRSEVVRLFSITNSRKMFSKATEYISEANTYITLFKCDICNEVYHRRELIRILNKKNTAETEVCENCYVENWTDCPECNRTVKNEQLIGDGCVYCQTNRKTTEENHETEDEVVETTTEELVDDSMASLDIQKPLSEEKIQDAYRSKVKEVHPDMGGSTDEFTDVKESKEVLLKHISEKNKSK